jgi:hypothetical protein
VTQLREKPPKATYAVAGSLGSVTTALIIRFGTLVVSAAPSTACHVPPTLFTAWRGWRQSEVFARYGRLPDGG